MVTSLGPSIANAITTTASEAPGNSTTMPLIEKKAAAPARKIAATYAATSMLAFGELSATVMTLPRRVTRPAFCQAFKRRLARCRRCHPYRRLGRRQVGASARLTSQPFKCRRLVERPDGCDIRHCLFPALHHLIV